MSKSPRPSSSRSVSSGESSPSAPDLKVTTPVNDVEPADPLAEPQQEGALDREERIRRAAYHRYQQRGGSGGDSVQDWLDAERDLDADGDRTDGRPSQQQ